MLLNKNIFVTLGSETDERLIEKVLKAVEDCGGVCTKENLFQVGGQEIWIRDFKIERSKISLEIETYQGVTLKGKKRIIDKVIKNLKTQD